MSNDESSLDLRAKMFHESQITQTTDSKSPLKECKAELHISDDYGDNHATMVCELEKGHEGRHAEYWGNNNTVRWTDDDKELANNETKE